MRTRIEHDFKWSAPNFDAAEWIVHVAVAPSTPRQLDTTTEAHVRQGDIVLELKSDREQSVLQRPILSSRWPNRAPGRPGSFQVHTVYETTFQRREPLDGRIGALAVEELSGHASRWYRSSTSVLDFDSAMMREWIDGAGLVRADGETETDFARRVLEFLKRRFKWIDVREFDPGHQASRVCRAMKGDCAKLSLVFVAILRVNQVPARILGVRWIPSGAGHIMTEFFAPSIGWVPVDVLVDKEGESHFAHEGLSTGFGSTTGDYFVHYIDDGFRLNSFDGVHEILGLHSVAWYARGEGSLENVKIEENWKVSAL